MYTDTNITRLKKVPKINIFYMDSSRNPLTNRIRKVLCKTYSLRIGCKRFLNERKVRTGFKVTFWYTLVLCVIITIMIIIGKGLIVMLKDKCAELTQNEEKAIEKYNVGVRKFFATHSLKLVGSYFLFTKIYLDNEIMDLTTYPVILALVFYVIGYITSTITLTQFNKDMGELTEYYTRLIR
jgi:hypothetical protein